MTSSKRAPARPRMACKRSKVRWVCGPMPPETSLPSVPRPVSPAVNRTREGLTLIPGMKPRPRSTGRSARISRRSIVSSFATRDSLRPEAPYCARERNAVKAALFPIGSHLPYDRRRSRAAEKGRDGRHDRPRAHRPGGCRRGSGGSAPCALALRAEPEVRSWEDGRGPRQRDRVQGSLGPLTHIADDKERAHDRRRRHHPESGLSRAYLL